MYSCGVDAWMALSSFLAVEQRRDPDLSRAQLAANSTPCASEFHYHELLQLRVLGLGSLQDGDVGVGVFPEIEEVLVRGAGFSAVALHDIGTA